MHTVQKWWKEAIVYQVWPASFQDSNGDGIGDIRGIIQRLDYLKDLGVTAVWVSPFFQSPQVDNGYDISDYKNVDPQFGTLADVEELLAEAKKRDMRILFDLVINHTSDQHPWFKESRSSRDNPKADWYFWRPAKIGPNGERLPPNNWQAVFGGSVWEWDETRQEYYLHYFCPEQPDLNWEKEEVRKAAYEDAIFFWLKKGVSGFRIDTVNMYSKDTRFEDVEVTDPALEFQPAFHKFSNGPRLHEFLKEMKAVAFSKYDAVTIGELPATPNFHHVLPFVSEREQELDMVLQFDIASIDHDETPGLAHPWKLSDFKSCTAECQKLVEPEHQAWAVSYLENHDQGRSVPRYGDASPEFRVPSAKMLAMYLLTLSGTPIIYQGEEIGTINVPAEWPVEEYTDVATVGFWKKFTGKHAGDEAMIERGRRDVNLTARDNARAPVQWTDEEGTAGFTTGKPWARIMDSYKEINAKAQLDDPDSVLSFYRELIKLRKAHPGPFVYGVFRLHTPEDENTMVYLKIHEDEKKKGEAERMLVALNFTGKPQTFSIPPGVELESASKAVSNYKDAKMSGPSLAPWEGRIYLL